MQVIAVNTPVWRSANIDKMHFNVCICTNLWGSALAPARKGQPGCGGSLHLAARSAEGRAKHTTGKEMATHNTLADRLAHYF